MASRQALVTTTVFIFICAAVVSAAAIPVEEDPVEPASLEVEPQVSVAPVFENPPQQDFDELSTQTQPMSASNPEDEKPQDETPPEGGAGGISAGAIAGIVIGGVAIGGLTYAGVLMMRRNRRAEQSTAFGSSSSQISSFTNRVA